MRDKGGRKAREGADRMTSSLSSSGAGMFDPTLAVQRKVTRLRSNGTFK